LKEARYVYFIFSRKDFKKVISVFIPRETPKFLVRLNKNKEAVMKMENGLTARNTREQFQDIYPSLPIFEKENRLNQFCISRPDLKPAVSALELCKSFFSEANFQVQKIASSRLRKLRFVCQTPSKQHLTYASQALRAKHV
jgi:hypothetical protein